MKYPLTCCILLLLRIITIAQPLSPDAFLGYELGSEFTRHHRVVDYFEHVAEQSEQVILTRYGKTYENRPLQLAFISSEHNLANLEEIRKDNLKRAKLLEGNPKSNVALVWLSYNVHGNESVSTEASMATLYELITSKKEWLENTVVIIDPCLNPDGRERYMNFYWQYAARPYNPAKASWEHHEPWPGGRYNHYFFDLNRDWAWLTQVESQQRIEVYNDWLPHVHVDFHEQGVDEPYYFAPAAKPMHELISPWQVEFQTEIGRNNARYFDQNNWLFFTKQRFDLLYPSYGDTYPTFNGAIGMTYEQGGSGRAGLGVIKEEGDTLTLKDRIQHHYTTGLSTVEATVSNREKMIEEFASFFDRRDEFDYKTYVLKYREQDHAKFEQIKKWLGQHDIQFGFSTYSKKLTGFHYSSGEVEPFEISQLDLVISTDQPKSVLATVLFEPQTQLEDSITYDITAWSAPYSFGIDAYATSVSLSVSNLDNATDPKSGESLPEALGYVFRWESMQDARVLAALLKEEFQVRYTTQPLVIENETYGRGSIFVTKRDNSSYPKFIQKLELIRKQFHCDIQPVYSGWMQAGPDLGSSDIKYLSRPNVALVGGEDVNPLDFGAVWYYFEQELQYPVSILSTNYFSSVALSQYDVLIMPNGQYGDFNDQILSRIDQWVKEGGKLIAMQGALDLWVDSETSQLTRYNSDEEKLTLQAIEDQFDEEMKLLPYKDRSRNYIKKYISGAIFKTHLDNTHPLGFGYDGHYFSLKTNSGRYGLLDEGNVAYIRSLEDHMAGFAGQMAKKNLNKSLVFGVESRGQGQLIYMVDNPLYRAFWQGGKLIFANAIFLVKD